MGKPTYRPRNTRRIRTHGFRARMATRWGRATLSRRRKKGVSVSPSSCRPSTPLAPESRGFPRSHRLTRDADLQAVRRDASGPRERVIVDVNAPEAAEVELFAEGPTPEWADRKSVV